MCRADTSQTVRSEGSGCIRTTSDSSHRAIAVADGWIRRALRLRGSGGGGCREGSDPSRGSSSCEASTATDWARQSAWNYRVKSILALPPVAFELQI